MHLECFKTAACMRNVADQKLQQTVLQQPYDIWSTAVPSAVLSGLSGLICAALCMADKDVESINVVMPPGCKVYHTPVHATLRQIGCCNHQGAWQGSNQPLLGTPAPHARQWKLPAAHKHACSDAYIHPTLHSY
jgi:hypothetical protein